jgi:CubicO group peptidase (beta-lactamase class C family)
LKRSWLNKFDWSFILSRKDAKPQRYRIFLLASLRLGLILNFEKEIVMRKGLISILQILTMFSLNSSATVQKCLTDTRHIYSRLIGDGKSYKQKQDSTERVSKDPKTWDWPISSPEAQGLDSEKLAELTEVICAGERFPRLHSLLIIRHGYLVVEEYFNNWQAGQLHTLQSVSKSFTSALVGIAIARGEFKGVDEKILDFFPDMKEIANLDERKASIRVEDLLTMRSGTDYHEKGPDAPHWQLNMLAKGWDKFYLDRPMIHSPGTEYLYDSGGVILISSMLKNRTGKHAAEYAERFLFKPLGIENKFWIKNLEGHTHTGGGLCLTTRDMAKLGLLYLQNGRWANEQIVPEEWIRESFRLHVEFSAQGPKGPGAIGYGYLWWILFPDPQGNGYQNIYAAMGHKAQYIFIIPEHDIVVVVNGDTQTGVDQNKPIEFLYNNILPAVASSKQEK